MTATDRESEADTDSQRDTDRQTGTDRQRVRQTESETHSVSETEQPTLLLQARRRNEIELFNVEERIESHWPAMSLHAGWCVCVCVLYARARVLARLFVHVACVLSLCA